MNLFRGAGVCPRGMGMFRRMRYRPNIFVVTKWQLPQGQFELEVRVRNDLFGKISRGAPRPAP